MSRVLTPATNASWVTGNECALTAPEALDARRLEVGVARVWDHQVQIADSGVQTTAAAPVAQVVTVVGALVPVGADVLVKLRLNRGTVDQLQHPAQHVHILGREQVGQGLALPGRKIQIGHRVLSLAFHLL